MIIKRIVRNEDGVEATLMLSNEQAAFLLNFAIGLLVQKGVVEMIDLSPEQFEAEQQSPKGEGDDSVGAPMETAVEVSPTTVTPSIDPQEALKVLESLNTKDMAKA